MRPTVLNPIADDIRSEALREAAAVALAMARAATKGDNTLGYKIAARLLDLSKVSPHSPTRTGSG